MSFKCERQVRMLKLILVLFSCSSDEGGYDGHGFLSKIVDIHVEVTVLVEMCFVCVNENVYSLLPVFIR